MSYNPNVPQNRPDAIKTTQAQLQANFQALFNAFRVNHVTLNDATATPGNHTIVELLEQVQAIETNVSEINIYTKEDADTTDQPFFRYQGNGQEFQFIPYQIYSLKDFDNNNGVTGSRFFTFLPGKVLVYFGTLNNSNQTELNLTLELFPAIAKNIITVSACVIGKTPAGNGTVQLSPPEDGFIKKIYFFPFSIQYLVMANI